MENPLPIDLATQHPLPVVHIGFHRTASSFLQTAVFSLLEGYVSNAEVLDTARSSPIPVHDPRFPRVYSDENICGSFRGSLKENAEKLKEIFPEARIIMVIRSQYEIFRSFYFLNLKGGLTLDYKEFVEKNAGRLFDYHLARSVYSKLFGAENVFVVLYEDIVAEPRRTVKEIIEFIGDDAGIAERIDPGKKVKPTPSSATLCALRLRNRLLKPVQTMSPELAAWVRRFGIPANRYLPSKLLGARKLESQYRDMRSVLDEVYKESNSRLFELIGKDIGKYDYPRTLEAIG